MIFFTFILSLVLGRTVPAPDNVNGASRNFAASRTVEVSSEQLAWSPDRRLSWEDFKAMPDSTNEHHAMTAANLAVDAKCNGNKFNYQVRCVFLPTESWTKNRRSQKLLQHEQMHFDLTEVHARLLRKKLEALGTSCTTAQNDLNETVSAAFAAWKKDQNRFDEASRHGLNAEVSNAWAIAINKKLDQLEQYK